MWRRKKWQAGFANAGEFENGLVHKLHHFKRWIALATKIYIWVVGAILTVIGLFAIGPTLALLPGALGVFTAMMLVVAWFFLVRIGVNMGLYPLVKAVRGIEASPREQFTLTIRFLGPGYLWLSLWFGLFSFILTSHSAVIGSGWFILALAIPFFALTRILSPIFLPRMLQAKLCEHSQLNDHVSALAAEARVAVSKVYVIPWSKYRIANAMTSGFRSPSIYVTDYLLENFPTCEVDAVIAHELGHLRLHHLWTRSAASLLLIVPWLGFFAFLQYPSPPSFGLWLFGVLLVISWAYYSLVLTGLSRRFEFQADRFVVSLGLSADVYISALEKLSRLDSVPRRWRWSERLFQTHPDMARRIEFLKETAMNLDGASLRGPRI